MPLFYELLDVIALVERMGHHDFAVFYAGDHSHWAGPLVLSKAIAGEGIAEDDGEFLTIFPRGSSCIAEAGHRAESAVSSLEAAGTALFSISLFARSLKHTR